MPNHGTVERFLQQLRDDESFRQRFVLDRDQILSQQTELNESERQALRALDMTAFLSACASVAINQAVQPIA